MNRGAVSRSSFGQLLSAQNGPFGMLTQDESGPDDAVPNKTEFCYLTSESSTRQPAK
jgi:hypothetical protein